MSKNSPVSVISFGLLVVLAYWIYSTNRKLHTFQPASEPFFSLQNADIHYEERNAHLKNISPTIIFSHGLLFSTRMWSEQMDFFEKLNFHIIAYDHRGQGLSSVPGDTDIIHIDDNFLDAAELIEKLDLKQKPIFVGLSMGGFTALRLAARRPDLVSKVIILDSSSHADLQPPLKKIQNTVFSWIVRLFGIPEVIVDNVAKQIFYHGVAPERLEEWKEKHLRGLKPTIYKAIMGVFDRPGIESEVPLIRAPTLILHGEKDQSLNPSEIAQAVEDIKQSIFVSLAETAHQSNLEKPDQVNQLILDFLMTEPSSSQGTVNQQQVNGTSLSSLDHLLLTAPTLEEGIKYISTLFGIEPALGGKHQKWGTHNAVLSLGTGIYLEIISKDETNPIEGPRPLALQERPSSTRLATWSARSILLPTRIERAKHVGIDLGTVTLGERLTASGELLKWSNTDFLRQDKPFGETPFFVDWSQTPPHLHPSVTAPQGCQLVSFEMVHPEPRKMKEKLLGMGIDLPVVEGPNPRYRAMVQTPNGIVELS